MKEKINKKVVKTTYADQKSIQRRVISFTESISQMSL